MNTKPALPAGIKSDLNTFISILLTVYNGAKTLSGCLESVLAQTHSDFELVVVDDGSSDATPSILSSYASKDERIRVITLPDNQGIVAALNKGLQECQGYWIARMDADDIMHAQRLEKQLAFMEDNPQVDILGCRIKLFRYSGEPSEGQIRYQNWSNSLLEDDQIKRNIFAESPIMHPTFFLKNSFYQTMEGYLDHPWAEDYDFLLRAYLKDAMFAKLPEVLVDKGDHPLRLARTDVRCKRQAMFRAKAHYFKEKFGTQLPKPQLLIVGSGSGGRMAFDALKELGVNVDGFVDNVKATGDRRIAGIPAISFDSRNPAVFFQTYRNALLLLCVGVEKSRVQLEDLFQQYQFQEGVDYLRFI